jgi:AraC family transcriptional regulator, transcriptional activator of pobA
MKRKLKKYDFKKGLPQEFEILDITSTFEVYKDILTTTHRAGFYHIIWFQQGSPTHLVDFTPIKIKPNTLLFLNKDIVQRFDNNTKFGGKAIIFTDSFFCKTEADTRFLRNSVLFNDLFAVSRIQLQQGSEIFANLLKQMTEELQKNNDNLQSGILHNLLHNFLLFSEREKRKQKVTEVKKGADLDYVMLFKDLLEEHYKAQKQVYFYSGQITITEKRLNQATSNVLGKSPKELIDHRILLEAKRMLAHTSESVKEIAYQLGFEEPTNFIKYFKKHTVQTPTEFRDTHASA